jgi:transposase
MMEKEEGGVILSSAPTGAEEIAVIREEEFGAIRALHERGLNQVQIARELGVDRKTVRKYLHTRWKPQRRASKKHQILEPWLNFLRNRAPEVGYNGVVLWRELLQQGFAGSYTSVSRWLKPLRRAAMDVPATIRFETEPGQQAQVDWGQVTYWDESEPRRVHLFVMVLGYSRRTFAFGYENERMDAFLDGHARAFKHFGGRTAELLYDNPRTIVNHKNEDTGEVSWNHTFKDRMDFYGAKVRLCRYYRAQTKGKVESGVKYVKRNAMAGRRFRNIDELNAWLLEWCTTIADERIHGTTHEKPSERFKRAEAEALISIDERAPTPRERVESRIVPSDAYVVIATNRYPVSSEWVHRCVQVRLIEKDIVIESEGEKIRYEQLEGRNRVAHWNGPARNFAHTRPARGTRGPQWDPTFLELIGQVEERPLTEYAAFLEEVVS